MSNNEVIIIILICGFIVGAITIFVRKYKPKEIEREVKEPEKIKSNVTINIDLPADFNIVKFEEEAKNKYEKMQYYFSNLDYNNLKKVLDEDLYKQFEAQMKHLEKNNKKSIRENIEFIDFKVNEYSSVNNKLMVRISIGVIEDKYTKYNDSDNYKVMSYENYYELELLSSNNLWVISKLKLIYSHSKKR